MYMYDDDVVVIVLVVLVIIIIIIDNDNNNKSDRINHQTANKNFCMRLNIISRRPKII
jgi:hypothetical protein